MGASTLVQGSERATRKPRLSCLSSVDSRSRFPARKSEGLLFQEPPLNTCSVQTPPVLYESLSKDGSHPRASLDRFVSGYRKAGGRVDLEWFDDESGDSFITGNPNTPAAIKAIAKVIEFVHREAK